MGSKTETTLRLGTQKEIEVAYKELERGDFAYAKSHWAKAARYLDALGIELPAGFLQLEKRIFSAGLPEEMRNARRALGTGNFSSAMLSIWTAETYAELAGLEVPKEIPEMRKQAYAISVNNKIETARKLVEEKKYPQAKRELAEAEDHATRYGISLSHETTELKLAIQALCA